MRETVRLALSILTPAGRRRLAALVLVMVLAAAVEGLGLASLYPFAAAAIDPAAGRRLWGFTDDQTMLLGLALGACAFFLLGKLADSLTHWLLHRFAYGERHRLGCELLERYLERPFVWLRGQHTADLTNDVLEAVHIATVQVLLRLGVTLARGLVALFIVAGLLWLAPGVSLVTAVSLGLLYGVVYRLVRAETGRRGTRREAASRLRQKALQAALAVVREGRARPARGYFVRAFAERSAEVGRLDAELEVVGELPSVVIQTAAFGSILGGATLLLATGHSAAQVFPTVGVFALAVLRLVPALEHVYCIGIRTRFHRATLERVAAELRLPRPAASEPRERLRLLQEVSLEGVTFSYPQRDVPAVLGVTLRLPRGTTTALVGRSGAGKTTVADLAAGLLTPQSGRLCVDGRELTEVAAWQANLGYVPQDVVLLDDTARRNVALGVADDEVDEDALERAVRGAGGLAFLAQGLDTLLGERGVSLSGGQRQRLGIARALYRDPDLLIFDEATSALDNLSEAEVLETLRELAAAGRTLLVIAHRLSTVRHCDNLIMLEEGRVVAQGDYASLRAGCPAFAALTIA